MTMNKILITILLAVSSFSLKAQDFMDGFHTFIDLYAGFPSGSFRASIPLVMTLKSTI